MQPPDFCSSKNKGDVNMEEFYLVKPDSSMEEEIGAFRKEFLDSKEEKMPGCSNLEKFSDMADWIKYTQDISSEFTLPKDSVLSEQYVYIRKNDGKIVGMIVCRKIHKGEDLESYRGNIGYSVRPSERRKGIAKKMLKDILPKCKEMGYKSISAICDMYNEGSKRVIISCGGRLEKKLYYKSHSICEERYVIYL